MSGTKAGVTCPLTTHGRGQDGVLRDGYHPGGLQDIARRMSWLMTRDEWQARISLWGGCLRIPRQLAQLAWAAIALDDWHL